MNIEKIEIKPNQYVWVDKDAEIKDGDLCVNIAHNVVVKPTDLEWANSNSNNLKVIIAASPELNLDVPTHKLWLASQKYKTIDEPQPTWDDVRKAIEMGRELSKIWPKPKWTKEEIIEQLKQKKK